MTAPPPRADAEWLAVAGLRLDVDDEVATITLDRPERRNAQTPATWHGLGRIARELPAHTRIVVVRGAGPTFSSGLDVRMLSPEGAPGEDSLLDLAGRPDHEVESFVSAAQDGFAWLRRPDIVSIASVHGHAIGAGFQLALACDLRVLAADARLAMRETTLGLVPDLGGTKPLVDIVGLARALEICLTGREVDAKEAAGLGLAELVVPSAELEGAVRDLVAALVAAPADAVADTKRLLLGAAGRSYEEQLAAERHAQLERLRALFRS
ncbi:MAG: enoyl-CoA hydratase/isomerase family protein [Streptosporangiaceae bacterium]